MARESSGERFGAPGWTRLADSREGSPTVKRAAVSQRRARLYQRLVRQKLNDDEPAAQPVAGADPVRRR